MKGGEKSQVSVEPEKEKTIINVWRFPLILKIINGQRLHRLGFLLFYIYIDFFATKN